MATIIQNQRLNLTENQVETPAEQKIWTDAEFMALNRDGHRYEIVNGELIDMGNSGAKHSYVAVILSAALFNCVSTRKLGAIFDSSTAFKMKSGNKRSPDVSFMAKERLQGLDDLPDGFLEGAPDLAVEILSPGNTVAEIHDKVVEYFENGARLVWVIHPQEQYVLVYRSSQEPDRLLKSTQSLDGEEIVPGFTLPIAELFQKLAF
ncbi:MAG TPA: Uma2 family endonuclease [Microcoleus sp.]|nr:Uma2 family endonuclease [Microcoleus sp.]